MYADVCSAFEDRDGYRYLQQNLQPPQRCVQDRRIDLVKSGVHHRVHKYKCSGEATVPRRHPRFAQGLRQVSSVNGNAFKTRKYACGRSDFTLQEGNTGDVPQVPAYPSQGATIAQVSAARIRR